MTRVGSYEIKNPLGKGSIGVVYSVYDPETNQTRTIKLVYPQLNQSPIFIDGFYKTISEVRKVNHPNLLEILDCGEERGQNFLIMPYMPNGSLRELLDRSAAIPERVAFKILNDVITGLQAAQSQALFHGGLKPSNILFDENKRLKISDLGFAKLLTMDELLHDPNLAVHRAYMAPELWAGKESDAGSDQFALGCILYEMLTGARLFAGSNAQEIMNQHQRPVQLPAQLSTKSKLILERMLAKDPGERYPNLAILESDLKRTPIEPVAHKAAAKDLRAGASAQTEEEDKDDKPAFFLPFFKPGQLRWVLPILLGLILITSTLIAIKGGWIGGGDKRSTDTVQSITANIMEIVTSTRSAFATERPTWTAIVISASETATRQPTRYITTQAPQQPATQRPATQVPPTQVPPTRVPPTNTPYPYVTTSAPPWWITPGTAVPPTPTKTATWYPSPTRTTHPPTATTRIPPTATTPVPPTAMPTPTSGIPWPTLTDPPTSTPRLTEDFFPPTPAP